MDKRVDLRAVPCPYLTPEEAWVFEELMGLPAHPLLVHGAVVLVPLLIAAAVTYAVVPYVRRWIAWAVVGLSVAAPLAAWFATLSGNAFRERLARQGAGPEMLAQIDQHRDFGTKTVWATLGLAVLAVLLVGAVVARARPRSSGSGSGPLVVTIVLTVGILLFAGASAYYVYQTGDTGARMVWGGS